MGAGCSCSSSTNLLPPPQPTRHSLLPSDIKSASPRCSPTSGAVTAAHAAPGPLQTGGPAAVSFNPAGHPSRNATPRPTRDQGGSSVCEKGHSRNSLHIDHFLESIVPAPALHSGCKPASSVCMSGAQQPAPEIAADERVSGDEAPLARRRPSFSARRQNSGVNDDDVPLPHMPDAGEEEPARTDGAESERCSHRASKRHSVVFPDAAELAAHSEKFNISEAGGVEAGTDVIAEASELFQQCQVNGRVTRNELLKCLAKAYEKRSVVFDDVSVGRWLDVSLQSLGRGPVDATVNEDELQLFYRCCVVFAHNKFRHLQLQLQQDTEYEYAAREDADEEHDDGGDTFDEDAPATAFPRAPSNRLGRPVHRRLPSRGATKHERHVFLGGSCNPTTWRADVAIPFLEERGKTFFNPQTDDWHPDLIEIEANAKDECHILLFVIDGQTRSIASMLEAVEYILRGRKVVIVVENIEDHTEIEGEEVTGRQLKDLNRARGFLMDIINRHPNNSIAFLSTMEALEYVCDVPCGACAEVEHRGPLGVHSWHFHSSSRGVDQAEEQQEEEDTQEVEELVARG